MLLQQRNQFLRCSRSKICRTCQGNGTDLLQRPTKIGCNLLTVIFRISDQHVRPFKRERNLFPHIPYPLRRMTMCPSEYRKVVKGTNRWPDKFWQVKIGAMKNAI